jgi:hypothetical protein
MLDSDEKKAAEKILSQSQIHFNLNYETPQPNFEDDFPHL